MKTFDYLKIVSAKIARKKDGKEIEDLKLKLDIFLMKDRITIEEYNQILEILEPKQTQE